MLNSVVQGRLPALSIKHFVAIAILHQERKFLLQLRGDRPGSDYSGYWGICGGHIEPQETPESGLQRELAEELGYAFLGLQPFAHYLELGVMSGVKCFAFQGDLGDRFSLNALHWKPGEETQDVALFTIEEIYQGAKFSAAIQQIRPIVPAYRKILLEFIHSEL